MHRERGGIEEGPLFCPCRLCIVMVIGQIPLNQSWRSPRPTRSRKTLAKNSSTDLCTSHPDRKDSPQFPVFSRHRIQFQRESLFLSQFKRRRLRGIQRGTSRRRAVSLSPPGKLCLNFFWPYPCPLWCFMSGGLGGGASEGGGGRKGGPFNEALAADRRSEVENEEGDLQNFFVSKESVKLCAGSLYCNGSCSCILREKHFHARTKTDFFKCCSGYQIAFENLLQKTNAEC